MSNRKARLAELMALRERKAMAHLARDYSAKSSQHARASEMVHTIQSMLKEKAAKPGTQTTTADLAASHWLGTALAGQLEHSRKIEAESDRSLAILRQKLAQQAQKQRVLAEKADLNRRIEAEAAADKADAVQSDMPRR